MSLNAATIEYLLSKGLTGEDLLEIARRSESRSKAAERQAAYRERKKQKRDVTRDVTPPLNDICSNPPEPVSAKADTAPFVAKVQETWNETAEANGLDTVRKIAGARLKHLVARRRAHGEEAVFEAIAKLARSDWHCGRVNGWKANFNWLFGSPGNFEKILELGGDATAPARLQSPEEQRAYLAKLAELDKRRGTGPPQQIAAALPKAMRDYQAKM